MLGICVALRLLIATDLHRICPDQRPSRCAFRGINPPPPPPGTRARAKARAKAEYLVAVEAMPHQNLASRFKSRSQSTCKRWSESGFESRMPPCVSVTNLDRGSGSESPCKRGLLLHACTVKPLLPGCLGTRSSESHKIM